MSDKRLSLRKAGLSKEVIQDILDPDNIIKGRKAPVKFDRERQAEFLAVYAVKGLKGKCAHAVGVSVDTIRRHQNDDPIFAQALAEATAIYQDSIRETVHNRAVEGWKEPVVYQGQIQKDKDGNPVTVTKFSDRLLELHARARVPEYRDKVDVNVSGGVLVVGAALTALEWTEQFKNMNTPKPVENLAK